MDRFSRLILGAMTVVALAACDEEPNPVAQVIVAPDSVVIPLNGTHFLNVSVQDANGQRVTRPTVWTSSDNAVAAVDTLGRVTANSVGLATITATSEGVSGSSDIRVVTIQYSSIETGGKHTCGIASIGLGLCWGQGTSGQLGDSTITNSTSPTVVRKIGQWSAMSAGLQHSCGLDNAGLAYCWGENIFGQLGDGTVSSRRAPTAVANTFSYTTIAAGGMHTCGTASSGTWCWGENASGQVGDSTLSARREPTLVKTNQTFTRVVTGNAHSCGLTAAGEAYCWGDNTYGQIGNGTFNHQRTPVAVLGAFTFAGIDAGGTHTCALVATGTAYCWGRGESGELGDSTVVNSSTPVMVLAEPGVSFTTGLAGGQHACGIATDQLGWCWGENSSGQLGDSTISSRTAPVRISSPLQWLGVSGGEDYSCGMTVTQNLVYCWGLNDVGQLGDGTLRRHRTPEKILGQP